MSQRPYCWHIMYPLNPGRLCEISAGVFSADMSALFDDVRNGTFIHYDYLIIMFIIRVMKKSFSNFKCTLNAAHKKRAESVPSLTYMSDIQCVMNV